MSKEFFISQGLFIQATGKISESEIAVNVKMQGCEIAGLVEFVPISKTKNENTCRQVEISKGVKVVLSISGTTTGEPIDFYTWQEVNNRIALQYAGISTVLGNAYLSGYFNGE